MKYQILFSGKNKKNIASLPSAEYAHSVLSFKYCSETVANLKDFM